MSSVTGQNIVKQRIVDCLEALRLVEILPATLLNSKQDENVREARKGEKQATEKNIMWTSLKACKEHQDLAILIAVRWIKVNSLLDILELLMKQCVEDQ